MTQVTDTGGNLGSSIKSVALYITSDEGAEALRFANMIAFKTEYSNVFNFQWRIKQIHKNEEELI